MDVSTAKVDFPPFGNTGVHNSVWVCAGILDLPAVYLQTQRITAMLVTQLLSVGAS